MRVHLLVNPSAGRGRARDFVDATDSALRRAGHAVTKVVGEAPGHLAAHVRGLAVDDVDRLLVAGGDGTLRSVVNARPTPPPWPVGLLPVGTANVVAREIGVLPSFQPNEVAEAVLASEPWTVDLLEVRRGGVHQKWAVLAVSIGFDAEVVHAVDRARGRGRGGTLGGGYWQWAGHVVDALGTSRLPPFRATVDAGPAQEYALLVVQNARSYGGLFTLSPSACLDSGRLDAVCMRARSVRDVVRALAAASVQRLHLDKQVRILPGEKVSIEASEEVAVQADGDPCGFTDVEVVLRPKALTLLRNPHAAPCT